jgi:hypothetical protein
MCLAAVVIYDKERGEVAAVVIHDKENGDVGCCCWLTVICRCSITIII